MPSGVPEKNPTMEPAATTPFRVTVSAPSLVILAGFCQKGEVVYVKHFSYLLLNKHAAVRYC